MESRRRDRQEDADLSACGRLNALVRLFMETKDPKQEGWFGEAETARILHLAGPTSSGVAAVMSSKSRMDVTQYLYSRSRGDSQCSGM
jgi:hypothetical protein